MSHARYKKIMEFLDISKTTPPPGFSTFFKNIILFLCFIELSKMIILIGNWLQVLNAKSWELQPECDEDWMQADWHNVARESVVRD